MASHRADIERQDEVPTEDALEQRQEVDPTADEDDERDRAQGNDAVLETPEGEFPADATGFDGTPLRQILEEREERLAPENRPENSEVTNSGREFDELKGMFTDEDGYADAEEKFDPDAV